MYRLLTIAITVLEALASAANRVLSQAIDKADKFDAKAYALRVTKANDAYNAALAARDRANKAAQVAAKAFTVELEAADEAHPMVAL